jgi:hypothetical protein
MFTARGWGMTRDVVKAVWAGEAEKLGGIGEGTLSKVRAWVESCKSLKWPDALPPAVKEDDGASTLAALSPGDAALPEEGPGLKRKESGENDKHNTSGTAGTPVPPEAVLTNAVPIFRPLLPSGVGWRVLPKGEMEEGLLLIGLVLGRKRRVIRPLPGGDPTLRTVVSVVVQAGVKMYEADRWLDGEGTCHCPAVGDYVAIPVGVRTFMRKGEGVGFRLRWGDVAEEGCF